VSAVTRLDRVATVQARIGWKALTADEYVDEGYAFLATPNIKSGTIDFKHVNYISEFRYQESPELQLAVGDVLLAKDGSTLGIANCVRELPRPATVNGSIAVLRPFASDPRFLMYWLQGAVIQAKIQQLKDGMGVPHLFQQDIRKLPVPTLGLDTQRRIADFLDDRVGGIDRVVAARRQQTMAILEEKDELVRRWTTTGDEEPVATGINWMPFVASRWTLPRLAYMYRTGSGSTPPSDDPSYYDGEIPWVNTGDIQDGRVSVIKRSLTQKALSNFPTLVQYDPGSLVIAMYGQGATKGRVGLLDVAASVNQACCVLQADQDLTEWAFHWFRAHKQFIIQLAMGSGQPNLSQEIIRALRIPIPPTREERHQILLQIASAEDAASRARTATARQAELLAEYKQSLVTAAVTGELDVTTAGSGVPR
jgi:type I restriction enzyme, S subunit